MSLLMQTACVEMSVSDRRLVSQTLDLTCGSLSGKAAVDLGSGSALRLYAVRQSHPVRASPR